MRRHLLTRLSGLLLALVACDDVDTIVDDDSNELVTTARTEQSAPTAKPGNGLALLFRVPDEARVLFLPSP